MERLRTPKARLTDSTQEQQPGRKSYFEVVRDGSPVVLCPHSIYQKMELELALHLTLYF